jgi:hypothetical protein
MLRRSLECRAAIELSWIRELAVQTSPSADTGCARLLRGHLTQAVVKAVTCSSVGDYRITIFMLRGAPEAHDACHENGESVIVNLVTGHTGS